MLSFEDIVSKEEGCSECGDGTVGAAPAENIQVVSCPDGSGNCQVATAATQGQIFRKLAGLTAMEVEPADLGGLHMANGNTLSTTQLGPNVLFFKAVPKTIEGQPDALSIIQSGVGSAPGTRVAVDVRGGLAGPVSFVYAMLMPTPGNPPPPSAPLVGPGSDFALVNIENAPTDFAPPDFSKAEKKTSTTTLIAGAVVGGGVGALAGGGIGAVAGAVGGAALANWLVG